MTFRKFNHREPVQIYFTAKSQTIQSEKDNVDINTIVRRYDASGHLPPDAGLGQYGDVTSLQAKDLTAHLTSLAETAQTLEQIQAEQMQKEQQQYEEFKEWQAAQNSDPAPDPAPDPE